MSEEMVERIAELVKLDERLTNMENMLAAIYAAAQIKDEPKKGK